MIWSNGWRPTWDILICSIEHRTDQLRQLLEALEPQMMPGVAVRICRDNLELKYGPKCQRLVDSSSADFISFIDDDDMVVADFIPTIMEALERDPDYIGFKVHYTEDGVVQVPVIHSIRYLGWYNTPNFLLRDLVHFNPIRRTLAVQSRYDRPDKFGDVGNGADWRWAEKMRELGIVKSEFYIAREMYLYQHTMADTFLATRKPLTQHVPRPEFPFVTYI